MPTLQPQVTNLVDLSAHVDGSDQLLACARGVVLAAPLCAAIRRCPLRGWEQFCRWEQQDLMVSSTLNLIFVNVTLPNLTTKICAQILYFTGGTLVGEGDT